MISGKRIWGKVKDRLLRVRSYFYKYLFLGKRIKELEAEVASLRRLMSICERNNPGPFVMYHSEWGLKPVKPKIKRKDR